MFWELMHESYRVGRPVMGLVASSVYLYNNEDASLVKALYFAFFYQLSANAGKEYVAWEFGEEEEKMGGRDFSVSRQKASSKNTLWVFYTATFIMAMMISAFDFNFFIIYMVIHEIGGHWMYNGLFFGYPMNDISFVKRHGFPLDVVVAALTYMPFPHLIATKSFLPTPTIAAWGTTMLWAQLKNYERDMNNNMQTAATVLRPFHTKFLISVSAGVMSYVDQRFLPYGLYTLYACYKFPNKVGKMSVVMALNTFLIVCFDGRVSSVVKFTTFGLQIMAVYWHYVWPSFYVKIFVIKKKDISREPCRSSSIKVFDGVDFM